jgi:hypothetical protein
VAFRLDMPVGDTLFAGQRDGSAIDQRTMTSNDFASDQAKKRPP